MGDVRGRVKWHELTVVDCLRPHSLPARDGTPEGSASWSPSSTIAVFWDPGQRRCASQGLILWAFLAAVVRWGVRRWGPVTHKALKNCDYV